jgi:hypothetical protein
VCVRGASALGELLARYPAAKVRVIVVWEPVIPTDKGPPTAAVRAPLSRDPRVVELWDEQLWMSSRAMKLAAEEARAAGREPPDPDDIAWDFVAIYPAGAKWEEPFPRPTWHGEPVVQSLAPVEELLESQ